MILGIVTDIHGPKWSRAVHGGSHRSFGDCQQASEGYKRSSRTSWHLGERFSGKSDERESCQWYWAMCQTSIGPGGTEGSVEAAATGSVTVCMLRDDPQWRWVTCQTSTAPSGTAVC